MKTKVIFALLMGLLMVMFFGCMTKKVTIKKTRPIDIDVVKSNNFIIWLYGYDPSIKPGDPLNFYNEYAIEVRARISDEGSIEENGSYVTNDDSKIVNFSIPAHTPGKIVRVEPGIYGPTYTVQFEVENGQTESSDVNDQIDASIGGSTRINGEGFSEDEKNPLNYRRVFKTLPMGAFQLDRRAEIQIHGKNTILNASVYGNSTGRCVLLVDRKHNDKRKFIYGKANGVPPIQGKKILKESGTQ